MNVLLELKAVNTYYGSSHVLQNVSLVAEAGQIVAIIGRNGVGKTTLVRSIMGLTPPRNGSILYCGQEIAGLSPYAISKLGIGLVPQGRYVFRSLDVIEHFDVSPLAKKNREWTKEKILTTFPSLNRVLRSRAGKLSGGEQQMLASARALANDPKLILMDEPTEGLAPIRVQDLAAVLRDLRDSGKTILLVEQNLPFALKLADFVYIIDKGTVAYAATPHELAANEAIKQRYLRLK
jgi:branched-chain amino acid transport system ATP-binding protein